MIQENDRDYRDNFFQLILGLLGVTQGLALNHLAERIPIIDGSVFEAEILIKIVNFSVAFIIIIRVFETYFSGSLLKVQTRFYFTDIVSIFAVGIVEYWTIDSLSQKINTSESFYFRVMFLAIAAVVLHGLTTYRFTLGGSIKLTDEKKKLAIKTELVNIPLSALVGLLCIIAFNCVSVPAQCAIGIAICVLMLVNVWNSLKALDLAGKRRVEIVEYRD